MYSGPRRSSPSANMLPDSEESAEAFRPNQFVDSTESLLSPAAFFPLLPGSIFSSRAATRYGVILMQSAMSALPLAAGLSAYRPHSEVASAACLLRVRMASRTDATAIMVAATMTRGRTASFGLRMPEKRVVAGLAAVASAGSGASKHRRAGSRRRALRAALLFCDGPRRPTTAR